MNTPLVSFLNNAIKAKELYKLDKDYVAMKRRGPHRRRVHRAHPARPTTRACNQAIEAKEGVQIKDENQTLATITLQNDFRLYDKLGGMTGTAITEANEFHQICRTSSASCRSRRTSR